MLRDRCDTCYHWMTPMYEVGDVAYDLTPSGLDEATYQEQQAAPEQEAIA